MVPSCRAVCNRHLLPSIQITFCRDFAAVLKCSQIIFMGISLRIRIRRGKKCPVIFSSLFCFAIIRYRQFLHTRQQGRAVFLRQIQPYAARTVQGQDFPSLSIVRKDRRAMGFHFYAGALYAACTVNRNLSQHRFCVRRQLMVKLLSICQRLQIGDKFLFILRQAFVKFTRLRNFRPDIDVRLHKPNVVYL